MKTPPSTAQQATQVQQYPSENVLLHLHFEVRHHSDFQVERVAVPTQ